MTIRSAQHVFLRNPLFEKCPSCGNSNSLRRSKSRNWKEGLIKHFLFRKIYRCRECGWRGYLFTFSLNKPGIKFILYYLAVAVITGFVVKLILSKMMP